MARRRDYKAEYRRRIERALTQGLSRSQARGHPRGFEKGIASKSRTPKSDDRLEAALKALRNGSSQHAAAKGTGISQERFRRFLYGNELAERQGRQWVLTDDRPRRVQTIHRGQSKAVTVPGFDEASKAGEYANAAGRFLRTNDLTHLEPFAGDGLTDVQGRFFPFETDPNALHRHAAADAPAFHEIYQIVSN